MTYNYVRAHRRKSGLSQRELAQVLGYGDQWQVSRHERSHSVPTLRTALAYEVAFRVPVSVIFGEMMRTTQEQVEARLAALEQGLSGNRALGRDAALVAHKLQWLQARRNR